jgi:hypothetical protein
MIDSCYLWIRYDERMSREGGAIERFVGMRVPENRVSGVKR